MPSFSSNEEALAYKEQFEKKYQALPEDPRLAVFLLDLANVFQTHGLTVRGCGECDSAWVEDTVTEKKVAGSIDYNPTTNTIDYSKVYGYV